MSDHEIDEADITALRKEGDLKAYIHGLNNIIEGVRQVRGTAANQIEEVDHVLVSAGQSGLILGRV